MLSWRDNWLVKQPFQSCMETPDWVQSQNILEYSCVPSDAQRGNMDVFPFVAFESTGCRVSPRTGDGAQSVENGDKFFLSARLMSDEEKPVAWIGIGVQEKSHY